MNGFSFQALINHIEAVIRQPELHMREVPILIGLAILLIFILLIFIAILFVRPGKRKARPIEEDELTPRLKKRYIAIGIFSLLTLSSYGLFSGYATRPDFCLSCHEMREAYRKSPDIIHKKLACVSCHQNPGITGASIGKLELFEMAIAESSVMGNIVSAQVSNEACLTCHDDILKTVRVHGTIKMKHEEPLEAGYRCTECHFSKGLFHVQKRQLDEFGMSRCVDCHNQKRAKANCSVCHTNQAGSTLVLNRDDYPRVNLPDRIDCSKCHLSSGCLDCHKIQLPHPESWKTGGHALRGFIEKRLCLECHNQEFCDKCHAEESPHGDYWVKGHGQTAKLSLAWCLSCHKSTDFCLECHDDVTSYKIREDIDKPQASSEDTGTTYH